MANTTTNTILVIGSTGKTGMRVTAQLEPKDFSAYARETAATGVWSPPLSSP